MLTALMLTAVDSLDVDCFALHAGAIQLDTLVAWAYKYSSSQSLFLCVCVSINTCIYVLHIDSAEQVRPEDRRRNPNTRR